ncbi:Ig domain-containing protein [Streptomyces sp. NPDC017943]|uniref:Ig domain-containing protein n=1 Tax=Streptomyces sp. NPDC017943 TaxID=3365019 RepID=UPI00379FE74E
MSVKSKQSAIHWTPTVSGAIGTRAFSTPRTFAFQDLPDWLAGDKVTGRIFGTPPTGATDVTFTVTVSDAYLPSQGASMRVTVPVKAKDRGLRKSRTKPPPRRR